MFFSKEKDGTTLITEVIGEFEGMVDKLKEGLTLCTDEMEGNLAAITALESANLDLSEQKEKAEKVIKNLTQLLGE